MKKVVINRCFGWFSLSHAAVMRYAEIKGFSLYAHVSAPKLGGGIDFDRYIPYVGGQDAFCIHYSRMPAIDGKLIAGAYFSERDIPRDDPALVQVVEEMGKMANGRCAELKVVKIPDHVEWHIHEYDGLEHVAEDHDTWE